MTVAKKATGRTKAPVKKATAAKKVAGTSKAPTKKLARTLTPVKSVGVKKASTRGGTRITNPGDVSARVVDEIPKVTRGSSKSTRYRDTLAAIRRDVGAGKSVIVAEFAGKAGAALARRQLLNGGLLCDGDPSDWTFSSRRVNDGGSILYAELNG